MSVLSQDYVDLECLVVDGASDDGSLAILKCFADDQRLQWSSETDAGIYDAMNKGIGKARGELLYFLGAGDILRDGVLKLISEAAHQSRSPGMLYGDVFWVDRQERYAAEYLPSGDLLSPYSFFATGLIRFAISRLC